MRERLDKPSHFFDQLLLRFVDKADLDEGYSARVKELKAGHEAPRNGLGKDFAFYEKLFEVLDAKSGALLTHISIMIAATVFAFAEGGQGVIMKLAFTAILASFLLIAICLIRCLRFWAAPPESEGETDYRLMMDMELHRRSEIYRFASQLAFLTTIASMVPLIITLW